jgi:hypothetical protein
MCRDKVLTAFSTSNGYYFYHRTPHEYENFIDGMAWIGILCGAAWRAGDKEVAGTCETYLENIIRVGPDARNFMPVRIKETQVESDTMPGYWYTQKAQSYAGPIALAWASSQGASFQGGDDLIDRGWKAARTLTKWGWAFGFLAKHIDWFVQHINTMHLAYLLRSKKPASSMAWMSFDNPFYQYIWGKKLETEYPPMWRDPAGFSEKRKTPVPLKDRKPSSWFFRNDPRVLYQRSHARKVPGAPEYTPVCQLVMEYLNGD